MPPQTSQIKALYRAYIKEGSKFPNYNIREYVKRKAREGFRADVTGEALDAAWAKAKADFEVVKRQAIVYSIYHRKQKSIMLRRVIPQHARPLKTRSRSLVLVAVAGDKRPLVVVGSVNADLVLRVSRLPKPGETLGAQDLSYFPGGKGANQAAAAGKLGYPTIFLGQVGTDANASMLVESLKECNVDLSLLRTVEGPSGTAVILLQPDGENSIIIVGGANTNGWQITDEARKILQSAGGVLLQREIPDDVNLEVAGIASAAGIPLIVDAGGVDSPLDPALLSSATVFSPNETELARLTGMPAETVEQATAAAREAQRRGASDVLVKRGSEGSLLVPQSGPVIAQPAAHVDKVVDTTGAGDCFTASFAVALLEGHSPQECLRFAGVAAALCVQRAGAMPSMPGRREVDALFRNP